MRPQRGGPLLGAGELLAGTRIPGPRGRGGRTAPPARAEPPSSGGEPCLHFRERPPGGTRASEMPGLRVEAGAKQGVGGQGLGAAGQRAAWRRQGPSATSPGSGPHGHHETCHEETCLNMRALSGEGGAPSQAKGRVEAGPGEARGRQGLSPTPGRSWADPPPRVWFPPPAQGLGCADTLVAIPGPRVYVGFTRPIPAAPRGPA